MFATEATKATVWVDVATAVTTVEVAVSVAFDGRKFTKQAGTVA